MAASSSPRFRIRLEDGSEVPVDSVEALARRVSRSDVLPDTPLFDGSTGEWLAAGTAPVVRFILDELTLDGASPPPGWENPPPQDHGEARQPNVSERPDEAHATPSGDPGPDAPRERSPIDPLDVGYTFQRLRPISKLDESEIEEDGSPARTENPASQAETTRGVREDPESVSEDPVDESVESASDDDESWLTPSSAGGLFAAARDENTEETRDEWIAPELRPKEAASVQPSASDPPSWTSARSKRRWAWFVGIVVVGGFAIGGRLVLGDDPRSDGSEELAGAEYADGDISTPPEGLEQSTETAVRLVVRGFTANADSIRAAYGLATAPPGPWLGGYYLANADEFPQVRDYWSRYGQLVEELRRLDRSVFLGVLDHDMGPGIVAASQRGRLDSYLRERYAARLPDRQAHFDQLESVAERAVALHDFLVERASALQFTPAVGTSVPRDPVLEVGTEEQEVQVLLEYHLDELFAALERSRRGGPPSTSGLRAELFGGFGAY